MTKYDNVDHIDAALYSERFEQLLETVRGRAPHHWLSDWVVTFSQRLCEVPVDLFASQDGFAEVEYILREDLAKLESQGAEGLIPAMNQRR